MVKKDYDEQGDLGTVAQVSRSMQKTMFQPAPLTVQKVGGHFESCFVPAAHEGKHKFSNRRCMSRSAEVS